MGVGQFGKWELIINYPWVRILNKGPFNNYVDKMRGRVGQKMSAFVHAQGIETVHDEGGGSKNGKMLTT